MPAAPPPILDYRDVIETRRDVRARRRRIVLNVKIIFVLLLSGGLFGLIVLWFVGLFWIASG